MGGLDRIFRRRAAFQQRPLAAIVAGLWKNGEQGVWYDVEGFRDSWNSVGPNLTPAVASVFGEASVVATGVYRVYSSAGAFSSVGAVTPTTAVPGRRYIVSFNVDSITTVGGGLVVESAENPQITTVGTKSFLVTASNSSLHIKRNSNACDFQISGLSAREWKGKPLCALFQDAVGTLPAYMPGQGQVDPPVGMLLDKRLGFTLGPELIGNTAFTTLDGWEAVRGATASAAGGVVTVTTADPNNWGSVSTPINTVPGKTYLVTAYVTATGGQNLQLLVSEHPTNHVNITNTGSAKNATGYYSLTFKATKAVHYVWLGSSSNAAGVAVSSWVAPTAREVSPNYAYQVSTPSRPILSARYNWAVATEDLTASVWQKGLPAFTINPKSTLAPDGVSWADVIVSPDTGPPIFSQVMAAQAPTVSLSFFIKPIANASALSLLFRNNTTATNYDGTTLNTVNGSAGVPAWVVSQAGNGWLKISYARSSGVSAGDQISIYAGATGAAATPGRSWSVWGLDVRAVGDGVGLPPYQRVGDANTYDTVGFPLYLRFDGVDDFLQTASIDFSAASSITAFAAVRKLSDATRGIIFELGTQGYGQPGSFNFEQAWFSPNFSASHSGASGSATTTKAGIGAPASAVLSAVFDQSAPAVRLRYQGQDASQNAGVVGGGGYLNAAIYIGRRAGTSSPASMRLYGAAIRTGVLGGMQIAAVEKLLNKKAKVF